MRGAGFASGQYTLFEFGSVSGALGNLTIVPLGDGFFSNLALGAGRVLLNTATAGELVWWNGTTLAPTGAVAGGDGTWSLAGANFTNAVGTVSGPWAGNGRLAVFGGTGGEVTIAAGEVLAPSGISFLADGYVIRGGDAAAGLSLAGPTGIDTADGVGARIDAVISGEGSLTKTGAGTLTLGANNTYAGLTTVLGGTLVNAGGIAGDVDVAATFVNRGTLGGTLALLDGGTAANEVGGTVLGTSTIGAGGTLTSAGTLAAVVNAGDLASTGTVNGSLTNQAGGVAQLAGSLFGNIDNSGAITLTGTTIGIEDVAQGLGASLDLAGFDTTIRSLSGAGSVDLGAGTLTLGAASGTASFAGTIGGTGGLVKTGDSTQVLSGTNTYTGLTRIDAGQLTLSGGSLAGPVLNNAVFAIENGARVGGDLTNSGLVEIAGQVDGAVLNAGSVNNFGAATYLGRFTQTAGGSYKLAGFGTTIGSLAGEGLVMLGGADLVLGTDDTSSTFGGAITGAGRVVKTGARTFTLAGENSFTGSVEVQDGELVIAAGGSLASALRNDSRTTNEGTIAGPVSNLGLFVNNGTLLGGAFSNGTFSNTGTIEGGFTNTGILTSTGTIEGGLIQSGLASATLAGTVNGAITNAAAITVTGDLAGDGRLDNLEGGRVLVAAGARWSGLTAIDNADAFVIAGEVATGGTVLNRAGASLAVEAGGMLGAALIANGGTLTNGGTLLGDTDNAGTIVNAGTITGTLTNGGSFTSTGTLTGTLVNLPDGTARLAGTLDGAVVNGGTIALTGTTTGITGMTQAAGGTFDIAGFDTSLGSLAGAGSVLLGTGRLTVGGNDASTTFAGVIGGSGGLTKVGAGTLTLSGVNTYAGLTAIDAGTLAVAASGAIAGDVLNAATLTNAGTIGGNVTSSGTLANSGTIAGLVSNAGTLTSEGTLGGGLANSGTAQVRGTLSGDVLNAGTLTLTGTTTGIGSFEQTAGGTFDIAGFDTSLGSLAGAGSVFLGAGRLTVGGDDAATTFAGVIEGAGGLTKVGAGTLSLSGVNTYTGLTAIDAGTLAVAASGAIAGSVTNAATLTNAGTIGGMVLNEGAGSATNSGTIAGLVSNDGTLVSTGTLGGGLANSGTAQVRGTLAGDVLNAGTLTLTGTTTGIGSFEQAAGGVFDIAGFDTRFGSLDGAGSVLLGAGRLTVGGNDATTAFAGVIEGAGGLTKVGAGTLTLSGANTYTGLTAVDAGTLAVAASGAIAGSVLNAGTLANSGTIAGTLANSAGGSAANSGTIAGLVTNGGTLTSTGTLGGGLVNNGAAQVRGTLAGDVLNAGTLTLTGTTTGIDSFEQIASGTFKIAGFDTSLGSLAGAGSVLLGAGRLTVGGNDAATTFAGVIEGAGGLTKAGAGTLTLSGVNTYAGLTAVDAGTLAVAASGGVAGSVINAATLTNAGTIGGNVTSSGTLANSGTIAGTLANSAAGSATNSGTITGLVSNAGTLVSTGTLGGGLANSGTAQVRGTLAGDVINAGTLTLTGTTTGIGIFEQTASGTFDLAGFDTTVGLLRGAGSITLGSARLTAGDGRTATFTGVISGSGGLTKAGGGLLALTGEHTYTGGTTISGGGLLLGAGTTSGSILGPVVNDGVLAFNRFDAFTFAGAISGTGQVFHIGAGTTTLTGANTYTGGTFVNRGRLVGDTTSLQGVIRIEAAGALEFAQGTAGTFAGALAGAGLFEKTGAGLLTLTGDSAAFTGAAAVRAGELRVNGALAGPVTVGSGASLSGNGVIGGLVAQGGSTVAPGADGPGMLAVAGNVSLEAGSTVRFQVAASGPMDRILATGTAGLGGTAAITNLSGVNAYTFGSEFVLLEAGGGRSGTFDAATGLAGFGILYRPELVYTGTQVRLRMAPNRLANIVGNTALTANQRAVVDRIDGAVTAGYNPQPLFNIYALPTAQLPGAFDQLSGEVYATAAGVGIEQERLVREAVLGRIGTVMAAARTSPEAGSKAGAWAQLFGGWGDGESDGNAAAFDTDRMGFATGIDFGKANENGGWRAGVFGMRIQSDVTIDARVSAAEVRQAGGGAYASLTIGGFGVALGGYLTEVDLRAFRDIALPGFAETNTGVTEGKGRQAFAELSYTLEAGRVTIRPFVAGSIGSFTIDALRESGGAAALDVRAQDYATGSVIGGVDGAVRVGKGLQLGGTLAARAQLGDRDPRAQIALAASPQQAFAIGGAQLDEVALAARFDAALTLEENLTVSLGYTGLIGATQQDHGARATIQVRF